MSLPRGPVDRAAAERAIRAFLVALGYDPAKSEDLQGTPARVTEAFETDLLAGEGVDVRELLLAESSVIGAAGPRGLVVVDRISVATICPHHLLPGLGQAAVAYLPGQRLVGIGTIARLVDAVARRLTLQEDIGESVVRALMEHAGASGAYCRLELTHSCLSARGARQGDARVVTIARAGADIPDASAGSRSWPSS
jgi:GTP cyclohydrolase I